MSCREFKINLIINYSILLYIVGSIGKGTLSAVFLDVM